MEGGEFTGDWAGRLHFGCRKRARALGLPKHPLGSAR